jgi:hypothetical protein
MQGNSNRKMCLPHKLSDNQQQQGISEQAWLFEADKIVFFSSKLRTEGFLSYILSYIAGWEYVGNNGQVSKWITEHSRNVTPQRNPITNVYGVSCVTFMIDKHCSSDTELAIS